MYSLLYWKKKSLLFLQIDSFHPVSHFDSIQMYICAPLPRRANQIAEWKYQPITALYSPSFWPMATQPAKEAAAIDHRSAAANQQLAS